LTLLNIDNAIEFEEKVILNISREKSLKLREEIQKLGWSREFNLEFKGDYLKEETLE